MPYEMLTSLTSRLYLSWELFTQGILILVPGSFFQLPLGRKGIWALRAAFIHEMLLDCRILVLSGYVPNVLTLLG